MIFKTKKDHYETKKDKKGRRKDDFETKKDKNEDLKKEQQRQKGT